MVLLASLLLFLGALLLVVGDWLQARRRVRQVTLRLQGHLVRENRFGNWLRILGSSKFGQRSVSIDSETQTLLSRLGWRRARERSLYAACQVSTPLLALGLGLFLQEVFFPHAPHGWLVPMLASGAGYLLPKRLLAYASGRRQKIIAVEVSTFIPLLRILFESGMAVEQALRVLGTEGQKLLPELTSELRLILARVDSGLELGQELNKASVILAVDEFSDTCVILQQLIQQGGGAMKSLLALKQLLDDRRLTCLQEYISKMSAKMSVVMMLFLFPALLIVLAGPGFTAITRAFAP
ncbi:MULTISPECIES: type II secretion system F family protein [unclassified Pseudomonas]|uniref:type II secretion system F family protein n=1 Tax=unclassified Pseudomonas TaxID=196821 RepID=UPI002AC955AB|nr:MULTISPECIES: type II secretion system F family protein [unclassified Pseudomonas]MEB0046876.1 type II secretion system F family protein [Pseudomonas sp. Dout3]MEB0098648.1 type II secretion system F family protein [Pseudomonas sp. DC1.2]WPX59614.1 type II secretion system F family protein [Pseudomonas sp. DC1.2]